MKNHEVEIKLELTKVEAEYIYSILRHKNATICYLQEDRYYCPIGTAAKDYMKTKCLRIRKQGDKTFLDYKEILPSCDIYTQHLIEYSTEISEACSMDAILNCIEMQPILSVVKERQEFIYNKAFRIAVDKVAGLGFFLEIEVLDEHVRIDDWLPRILQDLRVKETRINRKGYSNMLMELQKED